MFSPGIKVIGNVTIAVVLTYGGYRVLRRADRALGVLAAFLLYLRRFFEPMQELSQFYNALQSATAALEKLSGVLEERPAVPEPARADAAAGAERRRGRSSSRDGDVRLPRRTAGAARPDLTIPAGQTVALVGATGAGKSTVAKLVARFYDPVARRGPARRRRPARRSPTPTCAGRS